MHTLLAAAISAVMVSGCAFIVATSWHAGRPAAPAPDENLERLATTDEMRLAA